MLCAGAEPPREPQFGDRTLADVLGFALPQFGQAAHDDIARFAVTAEQLGAASLWVGDRLIAAVDPEVGYAGSDVVPVEFRTCLDPFVALSVAAAVTTTPRLGTSVLVGPWYPPALLARQLTSIDVVSGGRLGVGLGIGWSPEEYRAAGAPFEGRGAQLDELLDALDTWWTANPVLFNGARWSVPAAWVDLKPRQRPHPPVYLGAGTYTALQRIGRRADGWMPVVAVPGRIRADRLAVQRQTIDDAAIAAGRDPAAISTVVRVNVAAPAQIADVAAAIRLLAEGGYTDVFVDLMYVAGGVDDYVDWATKLLGET